MQASAHTGLQSLLQNVPIFTGACEKLFILEERIPTVASLPRNDIHFFDTLKCHDACVMAFVVSIYQYKYLFMGIPQIAEKRSFRRLQICPADGNGLPSCQYKIPPPHGLHPAKVDSKADMAPAQLPAGYLFQKRIQLFPGLHQLT